jgi:DNA-binding HxlR family transcriptional regulator
LISRVQRLLDVVNDTHQDEFTKFAVPSSRAADALATVGNKHRLAILRELAAADDPLAFSELRKRVGVSDTGLV